MCCYVEVWPNSVQTSGFLGIESDISLTLNIWRLFLVKWTLKLDTYMYSTMNQIRNTLSKAFAWNRIECKELAMTMNTLADYDKWKQWIEHSNPFSCNAVQSNYLPQVSHENGFSPLWILWWLCKVDSSLKARPQIEQLCGRSFVWYDKCRWYDCWNVNVRWHSSHVYGISPKKKVKSIYIGNDAMWDVLRGEIIANQIFTRM